MKELLSTPLFAILISLIAYILSHHISKKTKIALFNPLLLSMIFIISFLLIFNIPLDDYNNGGKLISFFLTPSTIVLALPLYNKIELFKKNALPIVIGITVGSFVGMISIILLCKLLNVDNTIALSLIPKSITTPIGMEISKQLQGIPAITVTAIIVTGIIGAIISPLVFKIFKIEDSLSVGIGIGTSSHAVGTSKALEMGEIEGAMSGLAIGIAGLITVCLSPIMLKIFNMLM